jgi:hypothetical protein
MGRQHGGEPTGQEHGAPEQTKNPVEIIKDMMPKAGGGKKGRKGSRRGRKGSRRGRKSSCKSKSKKGGQGVLATASVPFGLLALQRYFKGSKTSKRGVRRMGKSFKRTLRFKRKSRKNRKY